MASIPLVVQDTIRKMFNKFAPIPEPDGTVRWPNDEARRVFILKTAKQVNFSHGANWGTKKKDNNSPQTKDVLCTQTPFIGWDIINGTTGKLQFPSHIDLTGQVFISVTPTDYLGTTEPVPEPEPEPPPPSDIEDKLDRILADHERIFDILGSIKHESFQAAIRALTIIDNQHQSTPVEMRVPYLGTARGVVSGVPKPNPEN